MKILDILLRDAVIVDLKATAKRVLNPTSLQRRNQGVRFGPECAGAPCGVVVSVCASFGTPAAQGTEGEVLV